MESPRIIAATVRDDVVVSADEAAPVPWWSFTKTVLAAAAMALVAQGRMELDAAVPGRPYTLRHLLQHRSGLPDYGGLAEYQGAVAAGEPSWSEPDMLRRADAGRLLFAPGEGWAYSNIGYMMVARRIETAFGEDLGPALEQLVLRPLGIAGVSLAQGPEALTATGWGNPRGYDPGWVYHKLLIGAPAAAALLLHRLLAGRLLPPEWLAQMRMPHPVGGPIPDRPWRSAGYGLGLMIGDGEPDGRFIGHTGGGPGSTIAVFARADGRPGAGGLSVCTAAAAVSLDAPGPVERAAMALLRRG